MMYGSRRESRDIGDTRAARGKRDADERRSGG